jgi:hypothetical protein
MKQVYAVGSLTRNGTSGRASGLAHSTGVRPEDLRLALSTAGYSPPPASENRPLPVRLALLQVGPAGRVLTHVTPNGGSYFAHSLLNVPPTADAQLVIQTWGSPVWQRHEPDTTGDLPEMAYLPVADVLDDAVLKNWLADDRHREMLEFVFTALLGTPPTSSIVLAAPAQDVATMVYAVTRTLPLALLEEFTFSTYESDPAVCPARLVGHETGAADRELPVSCYDPGRVAFNPQTGRRSEVPAVGAFPAFAVAALADGTTTSLDELKAAWQRLGLREVRHLDLVFRLTRGAEPPTREETADALRHPPLAEWLADRAEVRERVLDWALADRDFATESLGRLVQGLRLQPATLAGLGRTVREQAVQAIRTGDRERAETALEVVLPLTVPAKAHTVWGELIAELGKPAELTGEIRNYLLPRLVRFKHQQGSTRVDATLTAWLDVPSERLGAWLDLDLPRAYQVEASRSCLKREAELSPTLIQTLAARPALTLALLRPEEGVTTARVLLLFDALLAQDPQTPWFEKILTHADDFPSELLNRFFESALAAGRVDVDRVVRTGGVRLAELFRGQSGLERVGLQFLADPPADLLRSDAVLEFLRRLNEDDRLATELKSRVAAVLAVRSYLDRPGFEAEAMTATASALSLTPPVVPPATRGELFTALANALVVRADEDSLQSDLETALIQFGPVLANDPADLFENLLRELRGRIDLRRHPNFVAVVLAVALGAVKSPELTGKLDGLDGHAFAVAADAGKQGGNRLLNRIDRLTQSWPRSARAQWGFLLPAVRPPGLKRLLRDTGFFLGGAAVATTAAWLARWLTT